MSIPQVFIQVVYMFPYLQMWIREKTVSQLEMFSLCDRWGQVIPLIHHANSTVAPLVSISCHSFILVFGQIPVEKKKVSIKQDMIVTYYLGTCARHLTTLVWGCLHPAGTFSPSCPKYHTSEISPLPADLLSHRAFSAVIPDSSHSCGAKIDLHPYVTGSAKQVLNYYSAPRISRGPCVRPAEICLSQHEIRSKYSE